MHGLVKASRHGFVVQLCALSHLRMRLCACCNDHRLQYACTRSRHNVQKAFGCCMQDVSSAATHKAHDKVQESTLRRSFMVPPYLQGGAVVTLRRSTPSHLRTSAAQLLHRLEGVTIMTFCTQGRPAGPCRSAVQTSASTCSVFLSRHKNTDAMSILLGRTHRMLLGRDDNSADWICMHLPPSLPEAHVVCKDGAEAGAVT